MVIAKPVWSGILLLARRPSFAKKYQQKVMATAALLESMT
jgi:F0F1-type ATP synthase membrane subunit c/vacuolar-type H+-ATPase subunit K